MSDTKLQDDDVGWAVIGSNIRSVENHPVFPAARTLAIGDLLTSVEAIPLIINAPDGGSWPDWTKSVDEILKMDFDRNNLFPSSGRINPLPNCTFRMEWVRVFSSSLVEACCEK